MMGGDTDLQGALDEALANAEDAEVRYWIRTALQHHVTDLES